MRFVPREREGPNTRVNLTPAYGWLKVTRKPSADCGTRHEE